MTVRGPGQPQTDEEHQRQIWESRCPELLAECGRLQEQLDAREHGFAKLVLLAHERSDEFWQNELQIEGDLTLNEARAALGVEGTPEPAASVAETMKGRLP